MRFDHGWPVVASRKNTSSFFNHSARHASLLFTVWKRNGYRRNLRGFGDWGSETPQGSQSWRNATTGSTRVARNAGKKQAAKPNATITKAPPSRETGSSAFRVHS